MFNSRQNKGQAALVIIIVLIIVVVLVYFLSAPAKTKIDMAYKEATTWTADNIQKDPVGYLTWALGEIKVTSNKIEAREIALKTKQKELEAGLVEKNTKLEQEKKALEMGKSAYLEASKNNSFPTTINGVVFKEIELKTKIGICESKQENKEQNIPNKQNIQNTKKVENIQNIGKFIATYQTSLNTIKSKLSEITNKKFEIDNLKVKLSSDLELAKLQKTVSDLPELSTNFNTIKYTAEALSDINGIKTDSLPDLSDLVSNNNSSLIDEEFAKIMSNQ